MNFEYFSGFLLNFCMFGLMIFIKVGSIFLNNWFIFDVCILGFFVVEVFNLVLFLVIRDLYVFFLWGLLEIFVMIFGLVDLIFFMWGFLIILFLVIFRFKCEIWLFILFEGNLFNFLLILFLFDIFFFWVMVFLNLYFNFDFLVFFWSFKSFVCFCCLVCRYLILFVNVCLVIFSFSVNFLVCNFFFKMECLFEVVDLFGVNSWGVLFFFLFEVFILVWFEWFFYNIELGGLMINFIYNYM